MTRYEWIHSFIGVVGWALHPKNGRSTLTDSELEIAAKLADRMVGKIIERHGHAPNITEVQ